MLVPGSANPLLLRTVAAAAGGISRSLRFNSNDSGYLSRTPASAGNRTTWTWAGWVKRSDITTNARQVLFSADGGANDTDYFEFGFGGITDLTSSLYWSQWTVAANSAAAFRDPSAWYHVVANYNGTNLTFYVNNVQVLQSAKTGNLGINGAWEHGIGRNANSGGVRYFSGYLADIYFIDGSALTPTSFTETDATTGQLVEKAYTGSYGTNGFHLDFADNASTTTIGYDAAGSNDWTANNLSVTAGAGNDSLVDVPTNGAQTDTGAGGEVRGNYCTLNPLYNIGSAALTNGNLDYSSVTGGNSTAGTIAATTGKWYWEVTANASGNQSWTVGVRNLATAAFVVYYAFDGRVYPADIAYGNTFAAGDVIGVALDMDNGKVFFSKNGTWQNSGNPSTGSNPAASSLSGPYTALVGHGSGASSSTSTANFGQRPFAYTAPSGFKALCTANLPAPLVTKPSTVFDTKLYTGNGSTQTISGLGFSPDLVWIKGRSGATDHALYDTVRGVQQQLESNTTTDETTESTGLTAFNSDGFALGALAQANTSSATYAAWCWDESVSAGFDIVTYTGNGSARTIAHSLGVAPSMIIVKARTTASTDQGWPVYHSANTAAPATDYLLLNSTAATADLDTVWNDTAPTSSVFSVGTNALVNANADTYVAYCFAPVVGYSSFGSYTGNGSADGPFVYTGMRPRYLLVKRTDATSSWEVYDAARNPSNLVTQLLEVNTAGTEFTGTTNYVVDFLSNGFKPRGTFTDLNASGGTYIYAAFAESPFNYARAR
jgi:hypothetical protein